MVNPCRDQSQEPVAEEPYRAAPGIVAAAGAATAAPATPRGAVILCHGYLGGDGRCSMQKGALGWSTTLATIRKRVVSTNSFQS